MNTRNLMRKLPSCLLGAIFVVGVASTTVNAVDGAPPGLFELEGDILDTGDPGTDWDYLHLGTLPLPANLITFTGITADPAPQTIYWKGGSKDINDVTEWWYKDGSTPDKDDITNAYAAAFSNPADVCLNSKSTPAVPLPAVLCTHPDAVPGPVHKKNDLIIYFGLDRFANDGDAFGGFWFFQDKVATNGNNQFTGQHVARRFDPIFPGDLSKSLPGDVLVLVEYPQASTADPEIKVYEWDPDDLDGDGNAAPNLDLLITEANAECDGLGGKLACAKTNLLDDPSFTFPPGWDYTPKSGSGLPHESFFEGGINVTRLLGTTPCFAAFLAETRASRSETATLKDFVIDEFPVCGIDVVKDCRGELNGTGTGVDVDFFGTLENTGGTSYTAYLKDDQPGSKIERVCVDVGVPGCENGTPGVPADDDPNVSGLLLNLDGSASFPLAAKAKVRYEGSYSVTGLPPKDLNGNSLHDKIIAEAYAKAADIGKPALVIVADADTADCGYAVDAKLLVTKKCTMAALDSNNQVKVTIEGTVKNTGDVPLTSVAVTDSVFGALTFPTTLAKGEEKPYSLTQSVSYLNLNPLPGTPDSNGVTTVSLTHKDKVTATAKVLDSKGETIATPSNFAEATCLGSFTTGIDVQKKCVVALDFNEVTGKIVVRVDVSATVKNLGDETLNTVALSDLPPVTFSGVVTPLVKGGSFTATGKYFPTTTDGGNVANPGAAAFSDTATVTAKGAFSSLSASDSHKATCDLCPPATN